MNTSQCAYVTSMCANLFNYMILLLTCAGFIIIVADPCYKHGGVTAAAAHTHAVEISAGHRSSCMPMTKFYGVMAFALGGVTIILANLHRCNQPLAQRPNCTPKRGALAAQYFAGSISVCIKFKVFCLPSSFPRRETGVGRLHDLFQCCRCARGRFEWSAGMALSAYLQRGRITLSRC